MNGNYTYYKRDYYPVTVIRHDDDVGGYEGFNFNTNMWYQKKNPDYEDIIDNYVEITEEEAMEIISDIKKEIANNTGN